MNTETKKWLAFGTGVGIEIGDRDLRVVCVRVRPNGTTITGDAVIERYAERPAAEWGAEYSALIRKSGAGHIAAQVLLPRRDVVVRALAFPGVASEDLAGAIGFQIDSLHPYPEEDAVWAWAPAGPEGSVLVGISRKQTIDRFATLFTEAGIKVASFTFSAAALYGAARLITTPPAEGFLALHRVGSDEIEAYGESAGGAILSASFDVPNEALEQRAVGLAVSELRLPPDQPVIRVADALPMPKSLAEGYDLSAVEMAYAAAISSACPRLCIQANLLPVELRAVNSRMLYVPTAALGTAALAGAIFLWIYSARQDSQYRQALTDELNRLTPKAKAALSMDANIATARRRALLLDDFRKRTRLDMDALNELTRTLQAPTWVSAMTMSRDSLSISGETDQAAALLKALDKTSSFRGSEFATPISRIANGESFSIRARRIAQ